MPHNARGAAGTPLSLAPMPRTAHSARASARPLLAAALLFAGVAVRAQVALPDTAVAAWPVETVLLVESQLGSADAITRGEAALALATLRRPDDLTKLIAIARDPAPEARVRGLLALGTYGRSGVDVVLVQALREDRRSELERCAAGFALGTLADDLLGRAYDELLKGRFGSGFRRDRGPALAFLLALAEGASTPHAAILREVLDDDANRDDLVRRLALRVLGRVPTNLDQKLVDRMLANRDADLRLEMLRLLAKTPANAELGQRVEKLAGGDPNAGVRAAALDALVQWRRPRALEIAARALTASDPGEAVAGLRGCLGLAAGYARSAAEAVVVRTAKPELRSELLRAWRGSAGAELRNHAASLVGDRKVPAETRVAAVEVLVESKDQRAKACARDLFFEVDDLALATRLAAAAAECGGDDELGKRIRAATTAADRVHATLRIAALVRAGHPDATLLAEEVLKDPHVAAEERARVLRALAHSRLAPVDLGTLVRLSEPLANLLR